VLGRAVQREKLRLRRDFQMVCPHLTRVGRIPGLALLAALLYPELACLYLHRRHKILRLRRHRWCGHLYYLLSVYLLGNDISPDADIGARVRFPHPVSIVIGGNARIGTRTTVFSHVCIGTNSAARHRYEYPRIGADVYVGTGAIVIGGVAIGRSSVIGAGAVVRSDIPSNVVCVGVPARVLSPSL